MGQGEKSQRGGRERPKILMDSPEDADIFHGEDIKVSCAARSESLAELWCLLTLLLVVNSYCLLDGILGSLRERRVSRMAARLGGR